MSLEVRTPHSEMIASAFAEVRHEINRRDSKRLNCSIPAQIYVQDDTHLVDCMIIDISATGMKIKHPNVTWLPSIFMIKSLVLREPVKVRQRWNNGNHIGLELV